MKLYIYRLDCGLCLKHGSYENSLAGWLRVQVLLVEVGLLWCPEESTLRDPHGDLGHLF